ARRAGPRRAAHGRSRRRRRRARRARRLPCAAPAPSPRASAGPRAAGGGGGRTAESPPREEAVRILRALGFAVDDSGEDLQVVVPSFRRDIHQEDDLVEEITRIWGAENTPRCA